MPGGALTPHSSMSISASPFHACFKYGYLSFDGIVKNLSRIDEKGIEVLGPLYSLRKNYNDNNSSSNKNNNNNEKGR